MPDRRGGAPSSAFIDTNVILYLASDDQRKAERAEGIVRQGGTISVQVLNEIANAGRRKMRLDWQQLHDFIDAIRRLLRVESLTVDVHESGMAIAERYGVSIYDGLIVASALQAGCTILWSEDMQDRLAIGDLRIANPFRTS
ncbi:PIN domain-containing protein [Chelativorans sp. AA-79]|uniref:PIN domain-containing protein n=1 Tax=Chelativorans sp. AA-79 TaxID=3028735 RepID=UPI0023F7CA8C|nr:PIN domain-containing protein [Chelativorans sp. AA-79]WEX10210.1 PIN domain-containing protein [Chelativorans sp. AA-79]